MLGWFDHRSVDPAVLKLVGKCDPTGVPVAIVGTGTDVYAVCPELVYDDHLLTSSKVSVDWSVEVSVEVSYVKAWCEIRGHVVDEVSDNELSTVECHCGTCLVFGHLVRLDYIEKVKSPVSSDVLGNVGSISIESPVTSFVVVALGHHPVYFGL